MVLEFPDGTQVTLETCHWDWGDYFETTVDNVVDFSAWLSEQELSDEFVEELKNGDKHLLIYLMNKYEWQLEEEDD